MRASSVLLAAGLFTGSCALAVAGETEPSAGPAADAPGAAERAEAPAPEPTELEQGKAKSAPCAACHAADGNSYMGTWPKISGQPADSTAKQLADYKSGARSDSMMQAAVASLTEEDMRLLGIFYEAQPIKPTPAPTELLELGRAVYDIGVPERKIPPCAACHGADGKGYNGHIPGGVPSLKGQAYEFHKVETTRFRDGKRTNDEQGMMQYAAKKLTDEEIDAVSQYVSAM